MVRARSSLQHATRSGSRALIALIAVIASLTLSHPLSAAPPAPASEATWIAHPQNATAIAVDGHWMVHFDGGVDWPFVRFAPETKALDWRRFNSVAIALTNTGDAVLDLFIRLGDDDNANWPAHSLATHLLLQPHQSTTAIIPFSAHDPLQQGMRAGAPPGGLPPGPTQVLPQPTGAIDPSHVQSLFVVIWGQTGARSLQLGPFVPMNLDWSQSRYHGLIDRYGQLARGQWPEQVHDDAMLKAATDGSAAKATSAQQPQDRYGGLLNARVEPASGFFRTARDAQGRWCFVSPLGHPFFSIGLNTVARGDGATYVAGREEMFTDLPAASDPLASHFGLADSRSTDFGQAGRQFAQGRWFNFYDANLQRKFGSDFATSWQQETLERMGAWGFNTIGNWSDPALFAAHRMPYTVAVSITGAFATIKGAHDLWGGLPDPFDPAFETAAHNALDAAAGEHQDDPWLLGYFVDNELPWRAGPDDTPAARLAVALGVLSQPMTGFAKQALLVFLQSRYASTEALDSAWAVQADTWGDLGVTPSSRPATINAAMQRDLTEFTGQLAERYYRIVHDSVRRADAHHLYLGSRFAAQTAEALNACDKWCDVVSFNLYASDFASASSDRFKTLSKPALVSEFSFSSTDRGPFWGGVVEVDDEAARAPAYTAYVEAVALDPQMIGVHWFQYLDEPATGRLLDGENAHFGLVSIADVPFAEFAQAVQAANRRALALRLAPAPIASAPQF